MSNEKTPRNPLRRRFAIGAGILVAALSVVGIAQARPFGPHGPGPHGFGRGFMRMMNGLDLTEQQELEAVRMRRAMREAGQEVREATRADMTAVAEELKKENPNRAFVHERINAAGGRMQNLANEMADRVLDFHAKLTPAQKAEVAKRIERHQARAEERRAYRRGR